MPETLLTGAAAAGGGPMAVLRCVCGGAAGAPAWQSGALPRGWARVVAANGGGACCCSAACVAVAADVLVITGALHARPATAVPA